MRFVTADDKDYSDALRFEDGDEVVVFFANNGGGLTIALSETDPSSGYNVEREIYRAINMEQIRKLRAYLNSQFAA